MKVLHLLQSNVFSGAENVVCQIINMFKHYDNMEMIYCSCDGPVRKSVEDRGVSFLPIKSLSVAEVKRVIAEQKPDIIHAHDRTACLIAALACGKTPVVAHMHVNNNKGIKMMAKNLLWTIAGIKYKHIFFVSDSSYKGFQFRKFIKKKSSVLYNIIDIDDLYKRTTEDSNDYNYDVVYVGRLSYQKHPERLMEVLHNSIKSNTNIKVAIAGDGDYADYVLNYIKENNLEDNIDYLGFVANPAKIIKNAKALVMTSRFEGTPMVALEALSLGTPVVSTPVDGLIKIIENNVNGYLSDETSELIEYILSIVDDKDKYNNLSKNSIEKSRQYNNIENYTKCLLDVYGIR